MRTRWFFDVSFEADPTLSGVFFLDACLCMLQRKAYYGRPKKMFKFSSDTDVGMSDSQWPLSFQGAFEKHIDFVILSGTGKRLWKVS